MAIQIEISNSKISGNAKLLNNVNIKGTSDAQIKVTELDMDGNASVLEDIEVSKVIEKLSTRIQELDRNSIEYKELQKILNTDVSRKDEIKKKMVTHLVDFSKGILASIIANFMT